MCPQKWYASASPGLMRLPAVSAPASAITPTPTRERKPRRDVEPARPSAARPIRSGMRRPAPPLGGREHALELGARVERALGEDGPVGADGARERAAGNVGERPHVGVLDLVEPPQLDERMPPERVDRGRERMADVAAVGREHGERDLGLVTGEALGERGPAADLGTLAGDLERA